MIRIIKFRAWDKRLKIMQSHVNVETYPDGSVGVWGDHSGRNTEDFDLMLFTGLKDKNGKDIYEGDILTSDLHLLGNKKPFIVSWSNHVSGFGLSNHAMLNYEEARKNIKVKGIYGNPLTVIGNMYEDEKLLK